MQINFEEERCAIALTLAKCFRNARKKFLLGLGENVRKGKQKLSAKSKGKTQIKGCTKKLSVESKGNTQVKGCTKKKPKYQRTVKKSSSKEPKDSLCEFTLSAIC